MKRIPLTQGKVALVDDEDYPMLVKHKWMAQKAPYNTHYACRRIKIKKADMSGKYESIHISMARQIMNPPDGFLVDHKDHNGLNYRKSNLRICTKSQNAQNKRGKKNTSSKYKGVIFQNNKYKAIFRPNGKTIVIGCFDNEIDAAKAYDKAARKSYGEFAYCNFV